MKVVLIFRPVIAGNFSFENIFHAVAAVLKNRVDFQKKYARSFFDFLTPLFLPFEKADIFHITGAVNYFGLTLPRRKTILTVHDIGFYENPVNKGLKKFIYKWLWFKLPLVRATRITVVSNFTKDKLISEFGVSKDKIDVIPNPVLPLFKRKACGGNSKFTILQIGSGQHKNIRGLLEAVDGMENIHLCLVSNLSRDEKDRLMRSGISYTQHFNLAVEQLVELYEKADLLYFASFYEGFGMPIIEANAVGVPVITSNMGAMRDVARNAAILVDPHSIQEIREAIISVRSDQKLRETLIDNGFKNAEQYSLQVVADKYFEVYQKVLSS